LVKLLMKVYLFPNHQENFWVRGEQQNQKSISNGAESRALTTRLQLKMGLLLYHIFCL